MNQILITPKPGLFRMSNNRNWQKRPHIGGELDELRTLSDVYCIQYRHGWLWKIDHATIYCQMECKWMLYGHSGLYPMSYLHFSTFQFCWSYIYMCIYACIYSHSLSQLYQYHLASTAYFSCTWIHPRTMAYISVVLGIQLLYWWY